MGKKAWGDPDVSAAMKAKIPLGKFCGMHCLITHQIVVLLTVLRFFTLFFSYNN